MFFKQTVEMKTKAQLNCLFMDAVWWNYARNFDRSNYLSTLSQY